jgi:hypothetical protein
MQNLWCPLQIILHPLQIILLLFASAFLALVPGPCGTSFGRAGFALAELDARMF